MSIPLQVYLIFPKYCFMIVICISEALKNVKLQAVNKMLCGIDSSIRQAHPASISPFCSFTSKTKKLSVNFPPWPPMLSRNPSIVEKSFLSYICSKAFSSGHESKYKNSTQFRDNTLSACVDSVSQLSHVDAEGHARMVNVGGKENTSRVATATGIVYLGRKTFDLVKANKVAKGDVLTVAQMAGIMASKLTPSLIPLCHNIQITHAKVDLELDDEKFAVHITATVTSVGRTGVEMESLTAVSVAALTIYDMCKAVSHDIVISDIKLVQKSGGKSGDYIHP